MARATIRTRSLRSRIYGRNRNSRNFRSWVLAKWLGPYMAERGRFEPPGPRKLLWARIRGPQREEAPDLFWPSPAVMISAIGSCKPLIPSRQPNRSRSQARRRSLKTHVAHSVRVGSPVRFRGLGNHQSILFVGGVMSGAMRDA